MFPLGLNFTPILIDFKKLLLKLVRRCRNPGDGAECFSTHGRYRPSRLPKRGQGPVGGPLLARHTLLHRLIIVHEAFSVVHDFIAGSRWKKSGPREHISGRR